MLLPLQNSAVQSFLAIFGNYSISRKSTSQGKQYLPIPEAVQRSIRYRRIRRSDTSKISNEKRTFQILVAYNKF
jgi:hypothetical protein